MGLLDDAIREHLELKRLRGADPGEVAREQQEALEPIGGEPATADHAEEAAAEEAAVVDARAASSVDDGSRAVTHIEPHDDVAGDTHAGRAVEHPSLVQETAELDMRSVLGGRPGSPATDGDQRDGAGEDEHHEDEDHEGEAHEHESLEWEVPAHRSEGALEESPEL